MQFRSDQKLLIDGSSGSGKSSLVDGFVWALYGRGRSDNKSLIKRGTTGARVVVLLEDDSTVYRIERCINNKGKHELNISKLENKKYVPIKITGLKDAQEYLERKILHSSYALFINSIVYPQDNIESFIQQPANKKKDILLEIINASAYDEYLKSAKEKLQENKTKKDVFVSKIDERQLLISGKKNAVKNLTEYEEVDKKIKIDIENNKKNRQAITAKQEEFNKKKNLTESKKNELNTIQERESENIDRTQLLNQKIIDLKKSDINKLKESVNKLNLHRAELVKLEQSKNEYLIWNTKYTALFKLSPVNPGYNDRIKEINRQLIDLMKERIELCPELNKVCPILENKRQFRMKELESDLRDTNVKFSDFQKELELHNKKIEDLGEAPIIDNRKIEELQVEINKLLPYEKQLIEVTKETDIIKDIEAELISLKTKQIELIAKKDIIIKEIDGYKELEKEEQDIRMKINSLDNDNAELTMEHSNNLELLTLARQADKDIKESELKLNEFKKELLEISDNVESLEAIKGAFSPNGIKAIMIDYIIPQFEDKINDILGRLSGFKIRLDTQKSGLSKDVTLEGLFINIINEQGEELNFESYSGGERIKISMAINEALAGFSNINMRIFDEAIVSLDNESTQKFLEAMNETQQRVNQIICISHIQEVKDIFDEKIIIKNINGQSIVT